MTADVPRCEGRRHHVTMISPSIAFRSDQARAESSPEHPLQEQTARIAIGSVVQHVLNCSRIVQQEIALRQPP